MGTGALRLAIVVALVAGGALILTRAFPEAGAGATPTRSPSPTATPTSSPTATAPPRTFEPEPPEKVRFAVYNGTFQVGAAGETQQRLEDEGFRAAQDADDWPEKPIARTVVYFVAGGQAKADATFVRDRYFPGARVQRYPQDGPELDPRAEVVILIGEDAVQG